MCLTFHLEWNLHNSHSILQSQSISIQTMNDQNGLMCQFHKTNMYQFEEKRQEVINGLFVLLTIYAHIRE